VEPVTIAHLPYDRGLLAGRTSLRTKLKQPRHITTTTTKTEIRFKYGLFAVNVPHIFDLRAAYTA